ncbi:MAG: hypothetical protein OXU77_07990 [Gammaproteobacteria bacterium]|nr:hypothetical protein [Gammaproteobacteria bacterium]MDE0444828.1 hypothetical protein [Gammaproteobacteria bacterium]
MSACKRPVDPLLTAELDELAGEADTELGRHVRDCPRCSATARKILAANVSLNASLAERRVLPGESLIARARSMQISPAAGRAWWRAQMPVAQPAWRWVPAAAAVGTLAIAAILLAVIGSEESLPGPEWDPNQTTPDYAGQPLLVDAPGYNVAVIPTANPDITIIWFSKESDDVQNVDPVRDGPIAIGSGNGL